MALDEMDKLSDNLRMSVKNAPPKWPEIRAAAEANGAGDWAMRKWLERKTIPAEWKLKIFEHTHGHVSFTDMEIHASPEGR